MMKKCFSVITGLILLPSLLTGCLGGSGDKAENGESQVFEQKISAAKSSVYSFGDIQDMMNADRPKPSSMFGVFASIYLARDIVIDAKSALHAVDAHIKLFRTEESNQRDTTFALLEEYGSLLQIDVIDSLNRSSERAKALDGILDSLFKLNGRVEEEMEHLDEKRGIFKQNRRDRTTTVREIKREIRAAEKEQTYGKIGKLQEQLAKAEAKLAEAESREQETKRIQGVFRELHDVGVERLEAMEKNRDILIAGLRVIDVPGIEDLGIYLKE